MFELPMLVVTWSRKAMSPIMRDDDPRQAGPLTRVPIGAGCRGAGAFGTDTAGDGPAHGVALMVMEDLAWLWQLVVVE